MYFFIVSIYFNENNIFNLNKPFPISLTIFCYFLSLCLKSENYGNFLKPNLFGFLFLMNLNLFFLFSNRTINWSSNAKLKQLFFLAPFSTESSSSKSSSSSSSICFFLPSLTLGQTTSSSDEWRRKRKRLQNPFTEKRLLNLKKCKTWPFLKNILRSFLSFRQQNAFKKSGL